MRATVFHGKDQIRVEEIERPHAGVGQAVIRVTLTTICGTDLHILRGEYPVLPGLVIGHEPVGVIDELGEGVTGYEVGDRVLVERSRPAASVADVCRVTSRNADTAKDMERWAVGDSVTRSRVAGLCAVGSA
jgi:threonine dehydrogenase-like Zn-dependent dehydrogenase